MSQPIYKATYSGVPVYEMACNGVAIMRRKNDSYMNATQILKVANFDKSQRTRILEQEIQIDKHEKIQGGYGKYQGTWVPLENAARLARNYRVDELIRPLLEFVKGDESPPLAPKHVTAASTKPRKPRERRARKKPTHVDDDASESGLSAKEDHPPRRTAATNDPIASDAYSENGSELQSKTSRHSRHKRTKLDTQLNDMDDFEMDTKATPQTSKSKRQQRQQINKPSDKPTRSLSSSPLSSPNLSPFSSTSPPLSPDERMSTTKVRKHMEHERTFAHKLLAHFLSENQAIPTLLQRPPRDLDVNAIIDKDGHTCLHWAAVMGNVATIQQLIQLEADLYRVNYKGQTALMGSVLYTNNYDQKTFKQLLDLLSGTIFNIDKADQSVFHHVAATAADKGNARASCYYMENLINKLAHNRSELISLLNVQDVRGETALTIASRIGDQQLVRLLIDAGASMEIANEVGMTPQDYLSTLDQHSAGKDGGDGNVSTIAATMTSHYQSEEVTREQIRQKVDIMYKTMRLGNTTTTSASLSYWIDDLAASYERDLDQKEKIIKQNKRDIEMAIKRLDETHESLRLLSGDQDQQVQEVLRHGDRLSQELHQVLLCLQETRLGKWIKEKEGDYRDDVKEGLSTSPKSIAVTPMSLSTNSTTDAAGLSENKILDARTENGDNKAKLVNRFSQLQQTRRKLMDDITTHHTKICDKRIRNYKRLISMCCNIAYENVDSMLAPILQSFDEAGVTSTKETITTKSS